VIRPDQKKFSFIQTTSVDEMIEKANKKHKQPEKNLLFNKGEDLTIDNFVDCRSQELRFDGPSRLIAIGTKKLLIMTERGQTFIVDVIFDQAEIDVAEAIFTPV
jgi:hypothetical protein